MIDETFSEQALACMKTLTNCQKCQHPREYHLRRGQIILWDGLGVRGKRATSSGCYHNHVSGGLADNWDGCSETFGGEDD